MTYYILTKRSAPSDGGKMSQRIHGITQDVWVARAWYRGTVVTDVVEIDFAKAPGNVAYFSTSTFISDTRLESWREQAYKNERLAAVLVK